MFGLHRNVHPQHMDESDVGMQAFSPTSGEGYQLSVDCEEIWLAKKSFEHRTVALSKQSVGVWTISRTFIKSLDLPVQADIEDDNPSHSLIVFPTAKSQKARRRDAARRLAAYANENSLSRISR